MSKFRLALLAALLLQQAGGAFAAGPGTTAANFLKIPVGARETALGGAFTPVADSPGAVFYNPAGLSRLEASEFWYSYNNYFSGISQHAAAAAFPAARGAWGFGVNYFQVGAFDSYDAQDNRTGRVAAYGAAASLAYGGAVRTGLALVPSLGYGASAKYITEKLDDTGADGGALDAGLLLRTGLDGLVLGGVLENAAASRLAFSGSGARPARKLKAGASYLIKGFPVSALLTAELAFPEDGPRYVSAGLENKLYGALFLRAGYTSFGDVSNGVTFGLGLDLPEGFGDGLRLDYSFGSTYDLGNVHKFGFSCRLGARPAAAQPGLPAAENARRQAAADFSSRLGDLYGEDPDRSIAAAEAFGAACGERELQHFSAMLGSGRQDWRIASLRGLTLCRGDKAAGLLAAALRDADAAVRRQAALALGTRGGPASRQALEEALRQEESEEVKGAILGALTGMPR